MEMLGTQAHIPFPCLFRSQLVRPVRCTICASSSFTSPEPRQAVQAGPALPLMRPHGSLRDRLIRPSFVSVCLYGCKDRGALALPASTSPRLGKLSLRQHGWLPLTVGGPNLGIACVSIWTKPLSMFSFFLFVCLLKSTRMWSFWETREWRKGMNGRPHWGTYRLD